MILAAGLGTRPASRATSLIRWRTNRSLQGRACLKAHGVSEIVVNAHRNQADANYINSGKPFGLPIHVRVEGDSGTGRNQELEVSGMTPPSL
jgi:NDP-sugar pyrophosphorylase family protein